MSKPVETSRAQMVRGDRTVTSTKTFPTVDRRAHPFLVRALVVLFLSTAPALAVLGTFGCFAEPAPEPAATPEDPATEKPDSTVPDSTVVVDDDRLPKISAVVEINEQEGELRVPCLFVNPTQALEVFGCHWFGPAHETVVAYLAEGRAIFDGLVRLGLRSPKFWNASLRVGEGRPDVRYTLGDRVVAFLRWEHEGKLHFLPAEKILREIGTGFSPFIRGFTFSGQEVLVGDPPRPGIAPHVEITIGGPTRGEKAVTSILFHPNDLRELTRWIAPLEIDSKELPDLRELVEKQIRCTLVLRKVVGEAALLDLALKYERDADRRSFLTSLRPIAGEIDLRKAAYARLVQRIIDLTAQDEKTLADPDALAKVEEELLELIGGGRLERDVLGIWQLYLKLFLAQETFRRRVLETDGLGELMLEQVRRLNERLSFEPRFVDLELQILNLHTQETPLSEKNRLLVEAFGFELEQRRHEAELPLAQLNLMPLRLRIVHQLRACLLAFLAVEATILVDVELLDDGALLRGQHRGRGERQER